SSFTYKGRATDVKQVGRELGVRYVLEGSVRRAGDRLRITGQLIDASTGANLWADRFDGALAEVFELQDQVAASVVGAIIPRVEEAEIERARRKPTTTSMPMTTTCAGWQSLPGLPPERPLMRRCAYSRPRFRIGSCAGRLLLRVSE